jgi:type I restriction enzyme S subunit
VGRVAIMPNGSTEFVYSPQVCYFRLGSDGPLSSRYLYYWFKSEWFWSQARSLKGQTDMADYINLADIRSLAITIPSRSAQDSIVDVLGAFDNKIVVNDRIVSAALALGNACFLMAQGATTRRSELAELAAEKTLIFGDGYRTKRSEHGQPGLPILRVAEVKDGRIEPEFVDFVADSYRSAMGERVSQAGDVILTSKGTVGRVAAITARSSATSEFRRILRCQAAMSISGCVAMTSGGKRKLEKVRRTWRTI